MSKPISLLSYPGGKGLLYRQILEYAPNMDDISEIRIPFAGGLGFTLPLLQELTPKQRERIRVTINDKFVPVARFWRVVRDHPHRLIDAIEADRREYRDLRELFYDKRYFLSRYSDNVSIACAVYSLCSLAHNSQFMHGGMSRNCFDFYDSRHYENIRKASHIIQGVRVTEDSYSKLLQADGEGVFIYCDSPYRTNIKDGKPYMKGSFYGANSKEENLAYNFDHQKYAKLLNESQHKILVSYDLNQENKEKLTSFKAHRIGEKNTEYLFQNYLDVADKREKFSAKKTTAKKPKNKRERLLQEQQFIIDSISEGMSSGEVLAIFKSRGMGADAKYYRMLKQLKDEGSI